MGLFGKDKTPEPAVVEEKKVASWAEEVADGAPNRAQYFSQLRTDAYVNRNLAENYVEFWAALRVDEESDKWRVMHYMIYDLDKPDGKFVSEVMNKGGDVTFGEALFQLARVENTAKTLDANYQAIKMDDVYPADKFPEIEAHFYDLEHYRGAANIEGWAFDRFNEPYRRLEGKIFTEAQFARSEVVKTMKAPEGARDNPKVRAKLEGGILSDIFCTAAQKSASLDNILNVGKRLSKMDEFAAQVGAFYLLVQEQMGKKDGFNLISGLETKEKEAVKGRAYDIAASVGGQSFANSVNDMVLSMNMTLDAASAVDVHVEPFRKFTAECELYANLLEASHALKTVQESYLSPGSVDEDNIAGIHRSVAKAEEKFRELGGTMEQRDTLRAWVANPKKDPMPPWLPGFLTRYYESRGKVMQMVQERRAKPGAQVSTLPAAVKPPVANDENPGVTETQKKMSSGTPKASSP